MLLEGLPIGSQGESLEDSRGLKEEDLLDAGNIWDLPIRYIIVETRVCFCSKVVFEVPALSIVRSQYFVIIIDRLNFVSSYHHKDSKSPSI